MVNVETLPLPGRAKQIVHFCQQQQQQQKRVTLMFFFAISRLLKSDLRHMLHRVRFIFDSIKSAATQATTEEREGRKK